MNVTEIYTSRKLESLIPSNLLLSESQGEQNPFGKWNATVFFVSRKKCLLMTNSITRYSVILAGIRKSDFKNLSEIFIDTLICQLKTDNIRSDEYTIRKLIGEVTIYRTDNNKAIIGTQNYILGIVDIWKTEFGAFENWDFREINRRVNSIPYNQLDCLFPHKKMRSLLDEIAGNPI